MPHHRPPFSLALAALLAAPVIAHADCPPLGPSIRPSGGPAAYTIMGRSPLVAPPKHHTPVPSGPLSGVRITLSRGACLGDCPIYKVTLFGDGHGVYEGRFFVLTSGTRRFDVPPQTLQCLVDAFRKADFWSLSDRYVAQITDNPSYEVSLTVGGQTKTVTDYIGQLVGMPRVVTDLELAVDAVGGTPWARGGPATLPALIADGLDVKGREGADLLARAAQYAPDEVAVALIKAGAPLDGHGDGFEGPGKGPSPLESAVRRGRPGLVRALLEAGAFAGAGAGKREALLQAAKHGDDVETRRRIEAAAARR
jgi:hypothetical protein